MLKWHHTISWTSRTRFWTRASSVVQSVHQPSHVHLLSKIGSPTNTDWWECWPLPPLWRAIWPPSSKTEGMHTLWGSNSTPKHRHPRENCAHESLCNSVYCSITGNGESWKQHKWSLTRHKTKLSATADYYTAGRWSTRATNSTINKSQQGWTIIKAKASHRKLHILQCYLRKV